MFYFFLLMIGFLGVAAYLLVVFREVPGAVDERLGRLEDLPHDLGEWKIDNDSAQGQAALSRGKQREVRLWREASSGFFSREKLVQQARYRDISSGKIEEVEADQALKRRRIKS